MPAATADLTPEQAAALVKQHGGLRPACRATGFEYGKMHRRYGQAVAAGLAKPLPPRAVPRERNSRALALKIGKDHKPAKPIVEGRVEERQTPALPTPKRGARTYFLTCAQNNTPVHGAMWENLCAFAQHLNARIMVSRFTYDTTSYGTGQVKPGKEKDPYEDLWYDERIAPFVSDERVEIAPSLIWCGEMNILPTAVRPLSGLENYTHRHSGVFPHVKIAMESIASAKHEPTKFNYTTGTVTQRNYIQKKAGLKADFHHCYGALLVEVDSDGDWFVRQINADSDGNFQDLDVRVTNGKVETGCRVEAITWGDLHTYWLADEQYELNWGREDSIGKTLRPRYQFAHDLLDFRARNHHDRGNHHRMFRRWAQGHDDVGQEVARCADLLAGIELPDCETVIVNSNHDDALEKWLREADFRADPVNAVFYLEAQLAKYRALEAGKDHHTLEWAVRRAGHEGGRFLREDESFVICQEHGGIECGMHGHLGPNGRRGTPQSLARIGRRANTAHTHSAGIIDGLYTAGTSAALDQEYNRGPSSWSRSHIVTYENSKRAILTEWNGKWRA